MTAQVIDSQKQNTNGYYSGSKLEKMLRQGHFAVTAELGPLKAQMAILSVRKLPCCADIAMQ